TRLYESTWLFPRVARAALPTHCARLLYTGFRDSAPRDSRENAGGKGDNYGEDVAIYLGFGDVVFSVCRHDQRAEYRGDHSKGCSEEKRESISRLGRHSRISIAKCRADETTAYVWPRDLFRRLHHPNVGPRFLFSGQSLSQPRHQRANHLANAASLS